MDHLGLISRQRFLLSVQLMKQAVAVVKSGQPALLNVWTQPR